MRSIVMAATAVMLASNPLHAVAASAAPATTPVQKQLSHYVDAFARTGFFSGVVLVETHGKPLLLSAHGTANREFGVPVTVDTKFQIASLSKPITSAAIGRLVDQGK